MSRQDANAAFALSSFLYGGNASYIEHLYARYEKDPQAVDAEWREFFGSLKDSPDAVSKPARDGGELVAALTGEWAEAAKTVGDKVKASKQTRGVELSAEQVQQATRDSVRALMLIRAYRIRGHLHAKLDPLGLEPEK